MGQNLKGIYAVLSHPLVYNFFARIMGAHQGRKAFVTEFIRPQDGMNILDIGCGPAEIRAYLPEVHYWGFDISHAYIDQATLRYGSKGQFRCKELNSLDLDDLPLFDIVLAIGLLHHLDDKQATDLFRLSFRALKPGGRLVTLDGCLDPKQNPIARFLIKNDRGQNVRTRSEYENLAKTVFKRTRVEIRHRTWIPYTFCFMECTRT